MPAAKINRTMSDGEEIAVGGGAIRAMHTPGHTPGSTCYLAGRILFSGDVLFPGGPVRAQSPADLQQSIASITERLYALPDETPVLPGHGADTIDESREAPGCHELIAIDQQTLNFLPVHLLQVKTQSDPALGADVPRAKESRLGRMR